MLMFSVFTIYSIDFLLDNDVDSNLDSFDSKYNESLLVTSIIRAF